MQVQPSEKNMSPSMPHIDAQEKSFKDQQEERVCFTALSFDNHRRRMNMIRRSHTLN